MRGGGGQVLGQVEDLRRGLNALADLGLRNSRDLEREAHVVRDGHVGVQRVGLEHHRDVAVLGLNVGDVAVANPDLALVDVLEAREHAQRRGLSAARGANENEELTVFDEDVELVDGRAFGARVDACCFVIGDSSHADVIPSPAGTCRTIRSEEHQCCVGIDTPVARAADPPILPRRAPRANPGAVAWHAWECGCANLAPDIGGYTVVAAIGRGGSGDVYTRHRSPRDTAALKLVDAQSDDAARQRLAREVDALKSLRHDAIPRILDAELDGPEPFLVFEYIDGVSLAHQVADHGPLRGDALADLAETVASALARRTAPASFTATSRRRT